MVVLNRAAALAFVLSGVLSPVFSQEYSTALNDAMGRLEGTLNVASQPFLSEGRLTGCQYVFEALMRDWTYRQGRFLKVSGAVGFMSGNGSNQNIGAIVKVVVGEIEGTGGDMSFVPSAPNRAYLIGPDFSTNLASLVAANPSDAAGGLFSIFQFSPTFEMVMAAIEAGKITIAFNSNGGDSDLLLLLELDVIDVDGMGTRSYSPAAKESFLGCMSALVGSATH